MSETVIDPIVQVVAEQGIQAIVHQIGYCIYYKEKVKILDDKVKDLLAISTEIKNKVSTATKNLDSIKRNVDIWLEKVEKLMKDDIMMGLRNFINGEEAEMFNHDRCCKGWCCLLTRHKIGREAHKKIVIIERLLNDGNSFDAVSYPCSDLVASVITQFVTTDDNISFASREVIMNEIMFALRDEETYSVGIYGMGGIGKTMLKNQVHKQAVEEKLFKTIATTTVSQNISVKKIQDDIAQVLGFEKLNGIDNTTTRAALLLERLKQEEELLVVLDDLWKRDLNLVTDLGIPFRYKGCKVLITTRNSEVCSSLKIQKLVKVEVLSEDESWHLFKQNAGDVVDSPALQKVAKEVFKECGCLPLALVTVGRALHNKDKSEWVYTANQLRCSNFTDIEGMTSEVHNSIKLSYDCLGSNILKRCFLLCCLFPEDLSIYADDLLIYAVADEVIRGDLENLVGVRVRLHKAITKLAALGLLIRDEGSPNKTFSAKMHDIVRDVAISIASGDGNRFYVKAGFHLQKWPQAGLSSMRNCSRLSLIGNNITVLPDQPELPHLSSLSLRYNSSLKKIPDKFFENMSELQCLDIFRTNISTLPSSISSLVNLQSLDMGFCLFHGQIDISALGELKQLEFLNLARLGLFISLPKEIGGSSISLPKEIGGLSRLKWLDLSENRGLTVAPDIISRLTCLEYLNMHNSFDGWEVGGTRGESCRFANLDEIAYLACLDHVALMARWGDGQTLKMITEQYYLSGSLSCYLSGTFPFCNSINIMVAKAEEVNLCRCSDLKNLTSFATSSRGSGFNNIKCLRIEECDEMECILDSTSIVAKEVLNPIGLFTALEGMYLNSLGNLKDTFRGPMPAEFSLENLKHVQLEHCPNLVCVFPLELSLKAKNLEELKLVSCAGVKEVFRGPMPAEFSLENLKRVEAEKCPNLVCLFSLEGNLKNLEKLKVKDCPMLREVFPLEDGSMLLASNDQKQEHGISCLLPQLRELLLEDLTITSIWKKQGIFSLGNLKSVIVVRCHRLKYLFTPATVTTLQQLETLVIKECSSSIRG